jgi:hypothetical protein
MGDADRPIERHVTIEAPDDTDEALEPEKDTAGHDTIALQLGWDIPAERRRQAERVARDDRPHVRSRRDLLGRLRRR